MLITVVIAGHKKSRRAAYLRLLQAEKGIKVIGEARNSLEAIAASVRLKPNILLIESDLSKENGIALLPVLRRISPETKAILLMRDGAETRLLKALSFGVRGYIEEALIATFLVKAVRLVSAGEVWVPRGMTVKIVSYLAHLTASSQISSGGLT